MLILIFYLNVNHPHSSIRPFIVPDKTRPISTGFKSETITQYGTRSAIEPCSALSNDIGNNYRSALALTAPAFPLTGSPRFSLNQETTLSMTGFWNQAGAPC